MDKMAFLHKLFALYPPEDKTEERMRYYAEILTSNKKYDYEKLMRIVGREWKNKYLPSTAWLVEKREQCKPENSIPANEGELVVMRLPNGRIYSFTVTGFGRTLNDIRSKCSSIYGGCKVEIYPKGSVLVGTTVIEP